MIISDSEIDLKNWSKLDSDKSKIMQILDFSIKFELNLRNSLFIDNTASDLITKTYSEYLKME